METAARGGSILALQPNQRRAAEQLQSAHDDFESRVLQRTSQLEGEVRDQQTANLAITHLLHRVVTAQEDERGRIARDLHDHFGQQLTAMRLALERAQQGDRASARADIEAALALTRQFGKDLDFLAWQLRPVVLDELGLAAALPCFVTEWSAQVGIPAEVRVTGWGHGQLAPDAEVAYYRVAQEALNNISKHANPARVDIVLSANAAEVVMVIEDDGIGFNPIGGARGRGLGLFSMRERATLVGAELQIESAPGKGTAIFLRKPMAPRATEDT